MIGTIRRHQTWLWAIVAAVTIASFIFYFDPSQRGSRGGSRAEGNLGLLNGRPITQEEFQRAVKEVMLGHRLNGQRLEDSSLQVQFEAYQTLFLAAKAEAMGIQVTPAAASEFANNNLLMGRVQLADFIQQFLKPLGMDESDFDRFLRHQVALRQLLAVVGTSGNVVTPAEAEIMYRAQNRQAEASLVYFSYSNYLAQVTNSAAEILQFYLGNASNYMTPEMVAVNFVKFPASNYLAEVKTVLTNLDDAVQRIYTQAGTNLPPGTKTPEEAKAKIREELLLANAQNRAQLAANAFAIKLEEAKARAGDMEAVARSNGLTMQTTAPFDRNGPEGMKVSSRFITGAFRLTNDMPFTGMIPTEDGAYVLGFKAKFEATLPPYTNIQSKVLADAREYKARQLAADAAAKFSASVEDQLNVNNGVTLPKDFATICAENDLKVESLPTLSLNMTNVSDALERRVGWSTLRGAVFGTPAGTASKAINAPEGAFVVYVNKLLPADLSREQAELPKFITDIRTARENETFEIWLNAEYNRDPGFVATLQELEKGMSRASGTAPKSAPAPKK